MKKGNLNVNLNFTLNQMTNSNKTNKFENFSLNDNLGFLNSSNTKNQNIIDNKQFTFQDKINYPLKKISFPEEKVIDLETQGNLRFSFNMPDNSVKHDKNKINDMTEKFNKENNNYEKIDLSNDNKNIKEIDDYGFKNKRLIESDKYSISDIKSKKGNNSKIIN